MNSVQTGKTFFTSPEADNLIAIKRRMASRPQTALAAEIQSATLSSSNINSNLINTSCPNSPMYKARIDFYHSSYSNFGKDAPHITIGTSRREAKVPPASPGPGTYNPPTDGIPQSGLKIKTRFPMAQRSANGEDISFTSNVDFINKPVFPETNKSMTIGNKPESTSFIQSNNQLASLVPGPTYVPASSLSPKSHKIANRTKMFVMEEDNPGPGTYAIVRDPGLSPTMPRAPAYSCQGPRDRSKWLTECVIRNPAPTDYRPKPDVVRKKYPEWTIGKKSRRTRRRKNPNPPKSRFIGIDLFVIPLDLAANVEEERRYIEEHPALKEMIHEIMEEILKEKPENPLDNIRRYFEKFRPPTINSSRKNSYLF